MCGAKRRNLTSKGSVPLFQKYCFPNLYRIHWAKPCEVIQPLISNNHVIDSNLKVQRIESWPTLNEMRTKQFRQFRFLPTLNEMRTKEEGGVEGLWDNNLIYCFSMANLLLASMGLVVTRKDEIKKSGPRRGPIDFLIYIM